MGGFQDQVARKLTGRLQWRQGDVKLKHTLAGVAR